MCAYSVGVLKIPLGVVATQKHIRFSPTLQYRFWCQMIFPGQADNLLPDLSLQLPRLLPTYGRPSAPQVELSPEEEQGLLGGAISGLQRVAEILDAPGAAARGIASGLTGGDWGGGLWNIVPFADAPIEDRITGRDLLTQWGITPENKPGLSAWADPREVLSDAAGFGAELLLDPLLPATFLMKTIKPAAAAARAGGELLDDAAKLAAQAAKSSGDEMAKAVAGSAAKAGEYLKTRLDTPSELAARTGVGMADEILRGDRALFSYGLPGIGYVHFGRGSELGAKAVKALWYGKFSVMPWMRAAFTNHLHGAIDREAQIALDMAFEQSNAVAARVQNAAPVVGRLWEQSATLYDEMATEFADSPNVAKNFQEFSRRMVESKGDTDRLFAELTEGANPDKARQFQEVWGSITEMMRSTKDEHYARIKELGIPAKMLDDMYVEHFPRRPRNPRAAEVWDQHWGNHQFILEGKFPFAFHRKFRDNPGGTVTLNAVAMDASLASTASRIGKKKWKAGFAPGTIVTDGKLYGRVVGGNSTNTVVNFMDGTRSVNLSMGKAKLRAIDEADVPSGAVLPPSLADEDSIAAFHRGWLASNTAEEGIADLSPARARELYAFHRYYVPAFEAEKRVGALAGRPVVDERELRRFLDGFKKGERIELGTDEAGEMLAEIADKDYPGAIGEMLKAMRAMPAEVLTDGLFNRSLVQDWANYMEHAVRTEANMHVLHRFLAQSVRASSGLDEESTIPLREAWASIHSHKGVPAYTPEGLNTLATNHLLDDPAGDIAGVLDNARVSTDAVRMLQRYADADSRDAHSAFTQLYDSYTSAWKAGVTTWRPAFHFRNLIDNIWRMWLGGGRGRYSTKTLIGAAADTASYGSGKSKTIEFSDEFESVSLLDAKRSRLVDVFNRPEDVVGDAYVPASGSLWDFARAFKKENRGTRSEWANPFNVRGVRDEAATGPQFLPAQAGEKMFASVEDFSRITQYVALRRSGHTPAQAAQIVKQTLYDYSNAGWFDRNIGRRVIPFWMFARQNIPYHVQGLLSAPGGRTAQSIRLIDAMRRDSGDAYVPSWLREKMAVRAGGPDEMATFIKGFGLSVEQLGELKVGGPNPVGRTIERQIANANPLLSLAYKGASGRDPFSGREINTMLDAHPVTGNREVDMILPSIPGGMAVLEGAETRDTMRGKQPWVSFLVDQLTGLSTGTYDLPKWRLIELSDQIAKKLEDTPGVKQLTMPYVPKEVQGKLDPQTLRILQARQSLGKKLRQLKAQRQKQPAA